MEDGGEDYSSDDEPIIFQEERTAPRVPIRRPDKLVCPTCKAVHLPVRGTQVITVREIQEVEVVQVGDVPVDRTDNNISQTGLRNAGELGNSSIPLSKSYEGSSGDVTPHMPPMVARIGSSNTIQRRNPNLPGIVRFSVNGRSITTDSARVRKAERTGDMTFRSLIEESLRERYPPVKVRYLCDFGGLRVFAPVTCPICLDERCRVVALKCGHCLCEADFQKLGGYLSSDKNKLGDESRLIRDL